MTQDSRQNSRADAAVPGQRPSARRASSGSRSARTTSPATRGARVPNYNGYQPDRDRASSSTPSQLPRRGQAVRDLPAVRRDASPGAACTTRTGTCRCCRRPARTAVPTGRTMSLQPQAQPDLLSRTASTRCALARRRQQRPARASGSTRPAASSRSTPRRSRALDEPPRPTDIGHGQSPLSRPAISCSSGMVDGYFLGAGRRRRARSCGGSRPAPSIAGAITLHDRRRAVRRGVRRRRRRSRTATRAAGRLALGVQARRDLQDRIGQQRGADADAARGPPAGRRQRGRGQHREQHDLARALAHRRHGRDADSVDDRRDEPDAPARARSARR